MGTAYGMRAVNYENTILTFGGKDGSSYSNTIFQFDPISEIWNYYGSIKNTRGWSAAELVKYDEYSQYCANSRAGESVIARNYDFCSGCATMLISLAPCRRLIRSKFHLYVFPVCCYNIRIFGHRSIAYRIECCNMKTLDC